MDNALPVEQKSRKPVVLIVLVFLVLLLVGAVFYISKANFESLNTAGESASETSPFSSVMDNTQNASCIDESGDFESLSDENGVEKYLSVEESAIKDSDGDVLFALAKVNPESTATDISVDSMEQKARFVSVDSNPQGFILVTGKVSSVGLDTAAIIIDASGDIYEAVVTSETAFWVSNSYNAPDKPITEPLRSTLSLLDTVKKDSLVIAAGFYDSAVPNKFVAKIVYLVRL